MSITSSKVPCFYLLIVAAFALVGCAGHSDFMTKVPKGAPAVAALPDRATVVFVRDSGYGFAVNFSIIDQAGNLLGDAVARAHFALTLPAGRYFFFARGGENTDVVQAEVGVGRLYYVHVIPNTGAWLARVELDPIKPNEQDARALPDWLATTDHLAPLIPKVAASVAEIPLPDWASKVWSSLNPSDQAAHTLAPNDGWLLPPSAPTVSVSTAPGQGPPQPTSNPALLTVARCPYEVESESCSTRASSDECGSKFSCPGAPKLKTQRLIGFRWVGGSDLAG